MNAATDGLVGKGPDWSEKIKVIGQPFLSSDGVWKQSGHGCTHVVDGERCVEDEVKRKADLEEAPCDWPA